MLIDFILGDSGEIRRDDGENIGTSFSSHPRKTDSLFRAGHAGPCIYGDTACDFLDNCLNYRLLFLIALDVCFPVGAKAEYGISICFQMPVYLISNLR